MEIFLVALTTNTFVFHHLLILATTHLIHLCSSLLIKFHFNKRTKYPYQMANKLLTVTNVKKKFISLTDHIAMTDIKSADVAFAVELRRKNTLYSSFSIRKMFNFCKPNAYYLLFCFVSAGNTRCMVDERPLQFSEVLLVQHHHASKPRRNR